MISTKIGKFLRSHVLGLVAIFVALTGTAVAGGNDGNGGPSASSSVVTDAKFKKLKKRVSALEAKPAPATPVIPTTLPPSGPAGGVLDGTYPAPGLADNTVGVTELIDGNVGAAELKNTYSSVSGGTTPAANTPADQTADCLGNDRVLGGGFSWSNQTAETHMVHSTPQDLADSDDWVVRGASEVAGNTLFAWAVCLPQ